MKTTALTTVLFASLSALTGCGDDASDPAAEASETSSASTGAQASSDAASTSAADPGGSEAGSESGEPPDIASLYDCEDGGLMELGPLAGPGYDPQAGWLEPLQESYVAHSTQILVRPDQMDAFFAVSAEVQAQLEQTPGLVAVAFAAEPTCGFVRTLGIWRSEQDMYTFVGTGAHAQAMARTVELSVTGKTVSWSIAAEDGPPSWDAAFAELSAVEPSGAYE